ncbi:Hsp20/alpha crystallin family protein [Tumebacillus sp. ITR2]|uniref:Hsp20/alpha crystallin family protein n=1 Tax=Tumebacillus amylolyticus TaxID=2801339 RepID=A0ABS1JEH4_9BACL|nr:Hsp20/alpha crystallin family protein [Tumebacillus amylolyticus]MBL0387988.1 Hsp20/alpha crystallin family protein [Tumebacillus amylolyticus]
MNNPMDGFRSLAGLNDQLRKMFGPQFFQNIMSQMPNNEMKTFHDMDWEQMFGKQLFDNKTTGVYPRIDIYETQQEVVAIVEVPGLEKAGDVNLNIKPDALTLSGSLAGRFSAIKDERFYLNERFRGSFERTVSLPARVRPQQARATYKNGLLEIRILKAGGKGPAKKPQPQNKGRSVPISFG